MPRLIGLAGRIGSGKSQCAKYLNEKRGFTVDAYGNILKAGVSIIFGVPVGSFYGTPEDRAKIDEYWGLSFREMLQKFGTEAIRNTFGEDFWEKALWRKYEGVRKNLVIEDCRFPNEAEAILERGGTVIEILRPSVTPEPVPWWKFWEKEHESEWPLPDHLVSYQILNDASIEQLNATLDRVLDEGNEHFGEGAV